MRIIGISVLIAVVAVGGQPDADDIYTMSNGKTCSREGSAVKPEVRVLNRLKNRFESPTVDDIDSDVSLATLLAPGEDEKRFDSAKAARLVGFVVDVKVGGNETCNCKATDPIDRDTHIELALAPGAPPNQRVIVEVTPRFRKQMREKEGDARADWRTLTLQSHGNGGIKGKWVEITGWLLFDIEHTDAAENTSPGNPKNWRATCWEIHPVTQISVLGGPPANFVAVEPSALRTLQQAHVMHVGRDKTRHDEIEARNKRNRDLFGPEETEPPK